MFVRTLLLKLNGVFLSMLALAAMLGSLLLAPLPAVAQTWPPTGVLGWCTVAGTGNPEACVTSPMEACQIQFNAYAVPTGPAAFDGMTLTDKWNVVHCEWHCIPVGTCTLPTSIYWKCASGYTRTALFRCGTALPTRDRQCCNSGGTPNPSTPGPIDILTGNKWFDELDFATADGSLTLRRTFNSLPFGGSRDAVYRPPLGLTNWMFDFQFEVQIPEDFAATRLVSVLTPNGVALVFQKQTNGTLTPYVAGPYTTPQTDYRLEFVGTWPTSLATLKNATSTWRLTDPQDRVWEFHTLADPYTGDFAVGRPVEMTTRGGREYTFTYGSVGELDSIADDLGKQIDFAWTYLSGMPIAISEAQLPGGSEIHYTYEAIPTGTATIDVPARLIRVEWIDASAAEQDQTSYDYGDARFPTYVTEILDRNDVSRWAVVYDGLGRATQSTGPSGAFNYEVAYGATTGTTIAQTVTNPLGKDIVYTFTRSSTSNFDLKLTSIAEQASTNSPASTTSLTYNTTNKFLETVTDGEGRVTKYVRDSRGRPTTITEAFGTGSARVTTVTWNSTFNLPDQIVRPGLTTAFGYDGSGRLTSRTLTDTTTITVPYSTNGRTHVWAYDWSTTGLLEGVDGPLSGTGDTVTYAYDASGYLESVTDQVGLETEVTGVDWRGAPTTVVDPNGVSTTLAYDIRGRPTLITVDPGANESEYQIEYDAAGNVSKVTLPEGGFLEYSWDAGNRLTGIENDRGQTVALTPNATGDPTDIEVKNASAVLTAEQSRQYDELGRLIALVGANAETTAFEYDKVDNLTDVTDARSKTWGFAFDPLNRAISATNPNSQTTEYGYDARDNLTLFEDGRNLQTPRVVDGFGNVIRETSPDRGVLTYWYDAADRLTQRTDGDGVEVDFTYDNAGRRTAATFPTSTAENVTYTYDSVAGGNKGKGRLTSLTDQTGSAAFTYDAQGRLTAEAKTIGSETYTVAYVYDANGQITQMTLPSGRVVDVARASDELITGVATKLNSGASSQTIASSVAYRPFGAMTSLTYGNGLALTRSFTTNEWMSRLEVKDGGTALLDLSYGRDNNGALTSVTDGAGTGRGATFTYTDSGRLASADGPWGDDDYVWDAAGNRTSQTRTIGGTPTVEAATIPSTSNRVTEIRNGGGVLQRAFTYRTGGSLTFDDRGTPEYEYLYNARDRLVTAKLNGTTVGSYGYDAFGRRVSRQTFGTGAISRHYIFDPDGRLLAEHNASTGDVVKEYIWVDDTPVAVIDSSSGSPVTYYIHAGQRDEPLAMTDATKALAWNVRYEPFGRATVFGSPSADLDLRLPGQWLQDETGGLHQNGFRDYDPSLGRYVEADPLGLSAGQNLYGYVEGDPLNLSDRLGRQTDEYESPFAYPPTFWNPGQEQDDFFQNLGELGDSISYGIDDARNGVRALFLTAAVRYRIADRVARSKAATKHCPPCRTVSGKVVPIGQLSFRLDAVPPSKPHHPFTGDHFHIFVALQSPGKCWCFWWEATAADVCPVGAIPREEFAN